MSDTELLQDTLSSWDTCISKGGSFTESKKAEKDASDDIPNRNDKLVSLFKETTEQIGIFFSDCQFAFFLLDTNFILLQIVSDADTILTLNKLDIDEGIQFRECIAGTNAFFMSKKWNRQVLLGTGNPGMEEPVYYSYFVPIEKNNLSLGYIFAIISEKEALERVLKFMDFAVLHIICRFCKCKAAGEKVINRKQEKILAYLAKGLTDKAIAMEMNINYATYKYHKKNLFKILDASCGAEAVIKGLKLGLITLEQFE